MNFNDYFNPVETVIPAISYVRPDKQVSSLVTQHTRDNPIFNIEKFHLAVFGIGLNNEYAAESFLAIRNQLYGLAAPHHKIKIYDLGNLKTGTTVNDNE